MRLIEDASSRCLAISLFDFTASIEKGIEAIDGIHFTVPFNALKFFPTTFSFSKLFDVVEPNRLKCFFHQFEIPSRRRKMDVVMHFRRASRYIYQFANSRLRPDAAWSELRFLVNQ